MSGEDSYSTPSSHIYSLSTGLSDLWLSTTSRIDCRFTGIGGYLFDISIDNFVTVGENTAAKVFAFKSYRVMDNSIYESSTIILMMEGFIPISMMGENEAEEEQFKSIRTTSSVNSCRLSCKCSSVPSDN